MSLFANVLCGGVHRCKYRDCCPIAFSCNHIFSVIKKNLLFRKESCASVCRCEYPYYVATSNSLEITCNIIVLKVGFTCSIRDSFLR